MGDGTQWSDSFTTDDYKALVKDMFDGKITVSNKTSKDVSAADFATVITVADHCEPDTTGKTASAVFSLCKIISPINGDAKNGEDNRPAIVNAANRAALIIALAIRAACGYNRQGICLQNGQMFLPTAKLVDYRLS